MSTSWNPFKHSRDGIRRISAVEFVLAVSVIVGLGFVSFRIKTMGFDGAGWNQAERSVAGAPGEARDGASAEPVLAESDVPRMKAELQPNPTAPAATKSP